MSTTQWLTMQPEPPFDILQAVLELWQKHPGLMSQLEAVDHIALHLDSTQSAQPPGAVVPSCH